MIKYHNKYGRITLTEEYLTSLAAMAAASCYGVVGFAFASVKDNFLYLLTGKKSYASKGIKVYMKNGELAIDMHIIISYGVSIRPTVKNITNKIGYTIENATGLTVGEINVYINSIAP
jgi:Uncharacterized protein conserved in bacteria